MKKQTNHPNYHQAPPVMVELSRGGIVESQHRAYVAVMASNGELLESYGDPEHVTFLRSSAKPLQAMNIILSGTAERLSLEERHLAIASGSHGGEAIHQSAVESLLAKAGLNVSALQCGVQPPLDSKFRKELLLSGEKPSPLHHNCSGKHSGMLATAVVLGYDINNYLDPKHPVQKDICRNIGIMASYDSQNIIIGIDGCSAPVHGMPMLNAALAFARLVSPDGLPDEFGKAATRISSAMRKYPELIAATRERICTELMRAVDPKFQLVAKAGAEGYYAVAWLDLKTGRGIGMTVKMEDGGQRGRDHIICTILQKYGVLPDPLPTTIMELVPTYITNWAGKVVGEYKVRL